MFFQQGGGTTLVAVVSEYQILCIHQSVIVSLSKLRTPEAQPNLAQFAQPDANGKISICSWQQQH